MSMTSHSINWTKHRRLPMFLTALMTGFVFTIGLTLYAHADTTSTPNTTSTNPMSSTSTDSGTTTTTTSTLDLNTHQGTTTTTTSTPSTSTNNQTTTSPLMSSALSDGTIPYKEHFKARLVGSEEVPPATTTASGEASFKVTPDESQIIYTLDVFGLGDITGVHIHCAPRGQNGPVVVNLMTHSQPVHIDGRLVAGTIRAEHILAAGASCSPNITTLPHLAQAMREGQAYVNVHSTRYPNGEIRGQLLTHLANSNQGSTIVNNDKFWIKEVHSDQPNMHSFTITITHDLWLRVSNVMPQLWNLISSFLNNL